MPRCLMPMINTIGYFYMLDLKHSAQVSVLGALLFSGCIPSDKTATAPIEASYDRAIITKLEDGGFLLNLRQVDYHERSAAVAKFRTTIPGSFILQSSDARDPIHAEVYWFIPTSTDTTNNDVNTILSTASFGALNGKGR